MKQFILSAEARLDLLQIWEYICQQGSIDAADKVINDLRLAMHKLADLPGMGHLRVDLAEEPLRFWPVHSYLIIYRFSSKPLGIVRILHGARDVRTILQSMKKK